MKKFCTKFFSQINHIILIFIMLAVSLPLSLNAALLHDIPQTLTQPNGAVIHCLASGDEFYNWLHDSNGYTIIQDPKTGYYVYADKLNGELIPTFHVVGTVEPESLGIEKWLKIAPEKIYEKAAQFHKAGQLPVKKNKSETVQVSGTINNLVIFIRFSDESEFTDATSTYNNMFNATSSSSMKSFFTEASYSQVTVNSTFYPTPGATVLSFQDSHVRNYYKPYNSVTNPIGYSGDGERTDREHTLLKNAVNAVKSQIPSGLNIDSDGNGFVDNICFIIYGAPGGWSDLLWPHQWTLFSYNVQINSKVVWKYNVQLQTVVNASVLSHEMFHTFGAPDLYHYGYDGKTPVGYWDLMEYNLNPPQHMGTYMKYKYGNWITSIPLISSSGTYQLNPITSSSNNCYRINSPFSTAEYFIVEYRKKTGTFESSIPGSGLLVYRIKTDCGNGNSEGPPDEVYLYRLDGTPSNNGNINQAHFSSDVGRTVINDLTNPSSFLYNGSAGGLILYDVSTAGTTISFKIGFGVAPPELKSPVNGADGLNINPLLTWYKSTDAVTYDLQVSTMSDMTSPLINLTGLTDTTYQVVTPLSNGIRYYWRVKTHTSIDTSEWSSIWNFRTIVGSPTLVTPVNHAHSLDTNLTFSWLAPFGADSYRLQISTDSNFSNITRDITSIIGTTQEVTGLNKNMKYYWHVIAYNGGGSGNWSSTWDLSTIIGPPNLLSPSNHAHNLPDSGYVIWYKNPLAVSYRVQISRFPDFSVNIFDQSNLTDTTFIYHGFENGALYFWRINCASDFDVSAWTSPWEFTIILGSPILLEPENHSSGLTDTVTFHWLTVNQATTYNLEVSSDFSFLSGIIEQSNINGTSAIVSGLNYNTKYFWRIAGQNEGGAGKWSLVNDFVTQLSPPTLINPNNFATVNPDSGLLSWETVPGATSYKLLISDTQEFSTAVVNDSLLTLTSYKYSGLEKNQTYYWKVSGKSSINSGKWSETRNFSTSFDAPNLVYPENNESSIPLNLVFRWDLLPFTDFYQIRVSTLDNFSTTVINDSNVNTNSYSFNNLVINTRYYWQVRAKKGTTWGSWSTMWSFSTSLSSPRLSAPPDGNLFVRISDTLRWKPVNGAANYGIHISESLEFTPVIINDFSLTDTLYNYKNLVNNTKYYWRVAAKNSNGTGEWSEVWNFTTRIATPIHLTPAKDAIKIMSSGNLTWTSVEGADKYNIQLSERNDFSNFVINGENIINNSIYYGNLKYETEHFWRINASNSAGTTDWSDSWKFTTDKFDYVEEPLIINNFISYPNPIVDNSILEINSEQESVIEINLVNILGLKVKNIYSGIVTKGIKKLECDFTSISSGIYYIEINDGIHLQRQAIIIER
ncbi:MAG: M6 family metalloprotease domain-containing protein [Ignavibacteriae bacterium]|nr:M6 family metalloprotease domain-containing protein [Ignavibacteriota bacterium]